MGRAAARVYLMPAVIRMSTCEPGGTWAPPAGSWYCTVRGRRSSSPRRAGSAVLEDLGVEACGVVVRERAGDGERLHGPGDAGHPVSVGGLVLAGAGQRGGGDGAAGVVQDRSPP